MATAHDWLTRCVSAPARLALWPSRGTLDDPGSAGEEWPVMRRSVSRVSMKQGGRVLIVVFCLCAARRRLPFGCRRDGRLRPGAASVCRSLQQRSRRTPSMGPGRSHRGPSRAPSSVRHDVMAGCSAPRIWPLIGRSGVTPCSSRRLAGRGPRCRCRRRAGSSSVRHWVCSSAAAGAVGHDLALIASMSWPSLGVAPSPTACVSAIPPRPMPMRRISWRPNGSTGAVMGAADGTMQTAADPRYPGAAGVLRPAADRGPAGPRPAGVR